MDYKIEEHKSDLLKIALQSEEKFKARARSISSYGGAVNMDTTTTRSFLKAIGSYENFPITEVEVEPQNSGVITLSPPLSGGIQEVEPRDDDFMIQSLGFLGSSAGYDIDLDTSSVYENDSMGLVDVQQNGDGPEQLFIAGYGGITEVELSEGQRTSVREEYLLAMDSTVSYKKISTAGLKEKALGADRNPYLKVTGPGKVYMHARSPLMSMETLSKLSED